MVEIEAKQDLIDDNQVIWEQVRELNNLTDIQKEKLSKKLDKLFPNWLPVEWWEKELNTLEKISLMEKDINSKVEAYNNKQISKEQLSIYIDGISLKDLKVTDVETSNKKKLLNNTILSIKNQIQNNLNPIESASNPEVTDRITDWAKEAYNNLFKDIEKKWFFSNKFKELWIDLKELWITDKEIKDSFYDYYTTTDSFQLEFSFDGQWFKSNWGFDYDEKEWKDNLTMQLLRAVGKTKEEFRKWFTSTLFHEMIHSIQKGKKNNINKFNEASDKIKYREWNDKIKNPERNILQKINMILVEWWAVSMAGIFEWVNDMSYHWEDIIVLNYIFLYSPNWETIKNEFLQFCLNGKKLPQEKIDTMIVNLYNEIKDNNDIKTMLDPTNSWDKTRIVNATINKIYTEKTEQELRFFKSSCAIPTMTNQEAKEYLTKRFIELDNNNKKDDKDKKENFLW